MGFGLLFIGYLLLFPITFGFFYTLPAAAVFLCLAGYRLARVNRPFGQSFFIALFIGCCGMAATILRLLSATANIAPYAEATTLLVVFLWHFVTLTGLAWVTRETGLTRLYAAALRDRVFACIYFSIACLLTAMDGAPIQGEAARFFVGANYVAVGLGLVVFLLDASLIFRAYAGICMPEDLDMPRKPSRFTFVNEARARGDARETAAREESRRRQEDYRARRLSAQEEKRKEKKGPRS